MRYFSPLPFLITGSSGTRIRTRGMHWCVKACRIVNFRLSHAQLTSSALPWEHLVTAMCPTGIACSPLMISYEVLYTSPSPDQGELQHPYQNRRCPLVCCSELHSQFSTITRSTHAKCTLVRTLGHRLVSTRKPGYRL